MHKSAKIPYFPPAPARGRPPTTQRRVGLYLRSLIVQGKLRPGDQLPTREQLTRQFAAGPVAVQKALDAMVRDGFVLSLRPAGTFVAAVPPHLVNASLVVPYARYGTPSSFLTESLLAVADDLSGTGPVRIKPMLDVDGRDDNESTRLVLADIEARRTGGLIFAFPPYALEGTPILDEPGIPRVSLQSEPSIPGVPIVTFDYKSLFDQALDYLLARGRRRIAILSASSTTGHWSDPRLQSSLQARGLHVPPWWVLTANPYDTPSIRTLVHLLTGPAARERPDGLLITDDHMFDGATQGVLDAGLHAPDDLDIVCHANFPHVSTGHLPAWRIGFDSRELLPICLDLLERQRKGLPYQQITELAARPQDCTSRTDVLTGGKI